MNQTLNTLKWKYLIMIFTLLPTLTSTAQKRELTLIFEGIGDNREFSGTKLLSQTILGSRASAEAAMTIDDHHLKAGFSHLYEFGSPVDNHDPELILYYQYEDVSKTFHFGSFPRQKLVNFPLAMLTDTLMYFRPNIGGMRGEYRWTRGFQNAFVDWTGRKAKLVRESFTTGTSGEISVDDFFIQNFIILNHLAHSAQRKPGEHVNDNLGYLFQAGWRKTGKTGWSGSMKAGILGSLYRERSVTDGYVTGSSLLAEASIKYRNFAMKNALHTGEPHIFLTGDPFYGYKNYMRTDAIWHFINHKNIRGRFNLSFHLVEWKDIYQSQQLSIMYILPYKQLSPEK